MEKSCFEGRFCSKAGFNKDCHSQEFLLGIFRILSSYVKKGDTLCDNDTYVEDPRLQASGMTANLMGFTQNVVICPPCGESVAGATKEGQNRKKTLWPLLPRLTAVLPPQGREMSNAFTLIELLVVVLIIGILAAVAVPQYQKAVEKSRATQALAMLDSAYKHVVMYYMGNGSYPSTFDEMGTDVPWPVTLQNSLKFSRAGCETETRSDGTWSLQLYPAYNGGFSIFIGHVTGKYAGAGFSVEVVDSTGKLAPKNIQCMERVDHGTIFEGDPGDYCVKIMNGTLNHTANNFRLYDLP